MKICVIGNSHVGMLAQVDAHKARGLDLTFFAKPQLAFQDLAVINGDLIAKSTDLQLWLDRLQTPRTLQLSEFDAIMIVAMTTSLFTVARVTQTHLVTGWPSAKRAIDAGAMGKPQTLTRRPLTRRALCQTLGALNGDSLAMSLAKGIRAACDRAIFFVPQPLPSETLLEHPKTYPVFKRLVARADANQAHEDLRATQDVGALALGGVQVLHQPSSTVAHGCLTKTEFTRGAMKLGSLDPQPSKDIIHANARLGRLILDQVGNV